MAKYRKKPVVIEASRWFKNGDHPEDGNEIFKDGRFKGELLEGRVVRYYRDPAYHAEQNTGGQCPVCSKPMFSHGWIDTLEGGHIVCPGDYIITGVNGERYPCKPGVFEKTYEKV